MPKAIKGNAGRKPPEPSAEHSDIDEWFGRLMPYLQPIVKGLDESIRAAVSSGHGPIRFWNPFAKPPRPWIF